MKRFGVVCAAAALASFAWSADFDEDAAFPPDPDTVDVSGEAFPEGDPAPAEGAVTEVAPAPVEEAVTQVTPAPVEQPVVQVSPSRKDRPAPKAEWVEPASVENPLESASAPSGAEHRVVQGDTLWDLAGAYLRNPYMWPSIWEANRGQIENPDLIFPDQRFVIPSVAAADALTAADPGSAGTEGVAPPETAVTPPAEGEAPWDQSPDATVQAAALPGQRERIPESVEPEPEYIDTAVSDELDALKRKSQAVAGAGFMGGTADTFVADKNWEYDGYILRDREQKMMISQGDVVYLNVGSTAGVAPKMTAHIYRVGQRVKDPYLKRQAGRLVKRVGSVIVTTEVGDNGCTAVVTNSLEPIRIGDIVKFMGR